jgi:hypothetical protein
MPALTVYFSFARKRGWNHSSDFPSNFLGMCYPAALLLGAQTRPLKIGWKNPKQAA